MMALAREPAAPAAAPGAWAALAAALGPSSPVSGSSSDDERAPFRRRMSRDRRGASGVVVTLLILLVAAGALSAVMAIYVPIWAKDTEAMQMKRVQSQMMALKENIDLQILAGKSSTFTTRLTLGDDGGPVLRLTRAPGTLSFSPESGGYRIGSASDPNETLGLAKGAMSYKPESRYYPEQGYRYENGALILQQGRSAVMKAGPHFDFRRQTDGTLSASVTLISLRGAAASRIGTGDIRVKSTLEIFDLTMHKGGDWELGRAVSVSLTTPFASVWADFFNQTFGRPEAGVVQGADYLVVVRENGVELTLFGVNRLDLGIALVEIGLEM